MFEIHSFNIWKTGEELAHLYSSGGKTNAEDIKAEFLSKDNFNASPLNYFIHYGHKIIGITLISSKNI